MGRLGFGGTAQRRRAKHGLLPGGYVADALIGALPQLPETPDVIVSTREELLAAIAAAPGDREYAIAVDTVELDLGQTNYPTYDATFDKSVTIDNANITLYPLAGFGEFEVNPYGDGKRYAWRFERLCTIKGFLRVVADNVRIIGFRRTLETHPEQPTQTDFHDWQSVNVASQSPLDRLVGPASNCELLYNEYVIGKDFLQTPFDIAETLPDFKTPAQWQFTADYSHIVEYGDPEGIGIVFDGHGADDWLCYNRYAYMPKAITLSAWTGVDALIEGNYIHDIGFGIHVDNRVNAQLSTVTVRNNHLERIYFDAMVFAQIESPTLRPVVQGNVVLDMLAHERDCMNPHDDFVQSYGWADTDGVWVAMPHWTFANNIFATSHLCRGMAQGFWMPASASNFGSTDLYKYVGLSIVNNLVSGSSKGAAIMGQQDTLIAHNLFVSQELERPNNGTYTPKGGIFLQRGDAAYVTGEAIPDSIARVESTVYEGNRSDRWKGSYRADNTLSLSDYDTPGRSDVTAPVFPRLNTPFENVSAIFNALRPSGGSYLLQTDLSAFLTASLPDLLRYGFVENPNAELDTLVESQPAYLHGRIGTERAVTPGPGTEWRILDAADQTEIASWSSQPGTAHSGELLQVRGTSGASELTTTVFSIAVDGNEQDFAVTTKATALWPLMEPGSGTQLKAIDAGVGSSDSDQALVALDFVYRASADLQYLFAVSAAPRFYSFIRANGTFVLVVRDTVTGATLANMELSETLVDGTRYQILASVDFSKSDIAEGLVCYINGTSAPLVSYATYVPGSLIAFGTSAERWSLLSASTGVTPLTSDLGMLAIWAGATADINDPMVRNRFAYSSVMSDGIAGITGAAPQILVHGPAAEVNATDAANRGSGGAFDNIGTDLVDLVETDPGEDPGDAGGGSETVSTAVMLGQSEMHRLTLAAQADLANAGTVEDEEALTLYYYDASDAQLSGAVTNTNKISRWAVEMSNMLAARTPGRKWHIAMLTKGGTGLEQLIDDSISVRNWAVDKACYDAMIAGSGVDAPDVAITDWQFNDSLTLVDDTLDFWWVFVTGTSLFDGAAIARGATYQGQPVDRFLSDLYNTVSVPMVFSMKRYDLLKNGAADIDRWRPLRVATDRLIEHPRNLERAVPLIRGLDAMDYKQGSDQYHPDIATDGADRYARNLVYNVLLGAGFADAAPLLDEVSWTAENVTLGSSAGPITTVRMQRGDALPDAEPKIANLYFYAATAPMVRVGVPDAAIRIDVDGKIVIDATALKGSAFVRGDQIAYGNGPTGSDDATDLANQTWKDAPGIADAEMEILPLRPWSGVDICMLGEAPALTDRIAAGFTLADLGMSARGDGFYMPPAGGSYAITSASGRVDASGAPTGINVMTLVVDVDRAMGYDNAIQNGYVAVMFRDLDATYNRQIVYASKVWQRTPFTLGIETPPSNYGYVWLPNGRLRLWFQVSNAVSNWVIELRAAANGYGAYTKPRLFDGAVPVEQIAALDPAA